MDERGPGPDPGTNPEVDSEHAIETADIRLLSRRELEAEVRRRTTELQDVMDTMADVLVTLDPEGHIEMANAAVGDVLGYDPGDLDGRPLSVLLAASDGNRGPDGAGGAGNDDPTAVYSASDLVERLVTDGTVTDLEVAFETADGRVLPMQVSASVMREDGSVDGYVCVATDVSERKARERELRRKNELLDEFAGVVSHDIATPLSLIENKARLVELTGDTSHIDDIHEATEEVQGLVDDLRNLAREGKRVGETTPVDVGTVARDAWQSVGTGGATLTVEDAPTVEADRDRLGQLFANLLGNAIEHGSTASDSGVAGETPERELVETDREGGSEAVPTVSVTVGGFPGGFYVADDGPGIPEAEYDQVFDQGFSTGEGGTGLGLAIVRRVAEGHGWSVEVTDSEAGGARFEVSTDH